MLTQGEKLVSPIRAHPNRLLHEPVAIYDSPRSLTMRGGRHRHTADQEQTCRDPARGAGTEPSPDQHRIATASGLTETLKASSKSLEIYGLSVGRTLDSKLMILSAFFLRRWMADFDEISVNRGSMVWIVADGKHASLRRLAGQTF